MYISGHIIMVEILMISVSLKAQSLMLS